MLHLIKYIHTIITKHQLKKSEKLFRNYTIDKDGVVRSVIGGKDENGKETKK